MGGPGSGRSSRPIRRTRPTTTLFCRFRSKRKPVWKEQDAARVCCSVIKAGGSMRLINARVQTLCPGEEPTDNQAEGSVMQIAMELRNIQAGFDVLLSDTHAAFLIINGLLVGFAFVAQLIPNPLVRVVSRGAQVAQVQVAGLLTRTISAQAAANDANFLINVLIARGARLAA